MSAVVDVLVGLPPWVVLLLVFALPAVEASAFVGLVVPGEVAVLVGGVVAHGGSLPLWAVIVVGILGAALGDQVGFVVGRRWGPRLVEHLPHRVRTGGEVDRALDLVRRRGGLAVVVGRWAAALRALVPGVAGMSGMRQLTFTLSNVVGGAIWVGVVAVAGFAAGASYRQLETRLGRGGEVVAAVVVVALVAAVLWRRHRSSPTPEA
ncbi:DedA family protein [Solicola sp. PLA-1-18]|uniref:DedA family protein n=1 Tax=Solicola sp. PLA-1-18 TaxID=3380532 RepID=UPI003B7D520A